MIEDDPTRHLASRIKLEREARGWSLAELAERSGVSKGMISKIERTEASPTAALLGRLSAAFGLTLSTLLARAEAGGSGINRLAQQPTWRDPATGYVRRQVSPNLGKMPLELTSIELPPGASVAFPAASYVFIRQMIWMLDGTLTFREGNATHVLEPGDCLALGPPADCTFHNAATTLCRYLVVVLREA
jgi:transcriptional regulator with XRE-family HTH domain